MSLLRRPTSTLLLEESEVKLVALLHRSGVLRGSTGCRFIQKWIVFVCGLHNSRLVQNTQVLVLSEEQKFAPRRRDAPPVLLVRCVQNIRLLAEKCIPLVVHILNNFRPSSAIFNSERVIGGAGQGPTHVTNSVMTLLLLVKLRNTVILICSVSLKLGHYVGSEVPALKGPAVDIIKATFLLVLGQNVLIIFRLIKLVHLVGDGRANIKDLRVVVGILLG